MGVRIRTARTFVIEAADIEATGVVTTGVVAAVRFGLAAGRRVPAGVARGLFAAIVRVGLSEQSVAAGVASLSVTVSEEVSQSRQRDRNHGDHEDAEAQELAKLK